MTIALQPQRLDELTEEQLGKVMDSIAERLSAASPELRGQAMAMLCHRVESGGQAFWGRLLKPLGRALFLARLPLFGPFVEQIERDLPSLPEEFADAYWELRVELERPD